MAEIHGLAAQVTLLLVVVVVVWSIVLILTRRPVGPLISGALVWVVILIAVTGLLGILVAATTRPPADPLHIVYGLLAVSVLPGAWAIARGRDDARRTAIVLLIASVILVILVVRLFQTGG